MCGMRRSARSRPTLSFQECSHYCELVVRPEQLPRVTQIAIQEAIGRGGVGVVTLPGDVADDTASGAYLEHTYRLDQRPSARPSDQVLEEFVGLVDEARRVTLFCGRVGRAADPRHRRAAHAGLLRARSMANALPQAIGAQLPDRGRQVIAMCGDGGFAMLMGDFLTLLQYDLPVKVVIFDNGSLGMVALEMLVAGYPPYKTGLKNPDFAAVARAAGMTGIRIEDPGDVRDGLHEALSADGPAVVDVLTDPNALSMPPKITGEQVKGFALAMSRLVLSGEADEVVNMARSNLRNLPRP
jgi:thiamine pyrophosphate-dependent acetolactate synthase large subunit-like protein